MSDNIQVFLDEIAARVRLQDESFRALVARYDALTVRYDEAIERIHNLQAELEYLRREVGRG